jgi:hypothetical protein
LDRRLRSGHSLPAGPVLPACQHTGLTVSVAGLATSSLPQGC